MDWRRRSACKDEDPELFYPVGSSGPAETQLLEAKAVCARCPVRKVCLAWSFEIKAEAGVWGGMSEEERRNLKKSRNQSAGSRR
jgi:WhiB family redox-sensing transcriptional regulator